MKFLVRKRRSTPTVIIVALIDVLIVLVIFLLVTTTFKQTPNFRLTVPTSRQPLQSGVSDNPPQVVSIPGSRDLPLYLGVNPCTLDQLQRQLTAMAAQNPKLKVAVRADTNAPWSRMVEVMDAVKAANVKDVSAFTKEAGKP